jgi:hypothetical protein
MAGFGYTRPALNLKRFLRDKLLSPTSHKDYARLHLASFRNFSSIVIPRIGLFPARHTVSRANPTSSLCGSAKQPACSPASPVGIYFSVSSPFSSVNVCPALLQSHRIHSRRRADL